MFEKEIMAQSRISIDQIFDRLCLNTDVSLEQTQISNNIKKWWQQQNKTQKNALFYPELIIAPLPQTQNFNRLEKEFISDDDPQYHVGIRHSFSMAFGTTKKGKRLKGLLLAYQLGNPVPIAFTCFSFFLMDSWQVFGVESEPKGIGLCCHLNYTYVKSGWRQQGVAHSLVEGLSQYFIAQLKIIEQQINHIQQSLTPIIYCGTHAANGDFLVKHIENHINQYHHSSKVNFCPCITNI